MTAERSRTTLGVLVGRGHKIALFALPFVLVGLALNFALPSAFEVGGPPLALAAVSIVALISGVTIWVWSVVLILVKVPRGELITSGPYVFMKHPLYTGVALCVVPWAGFLMNGWVGVVRLENRALTVEIADPVLTPGVLAGSACHGAARPRVSPSGVRSRR